MQNVLGIYPMVHRRNKAFTLPEMMIVVALIGAVMIMLVPKIGSTDKYRRNAAVKAGIMAVANGLQVLKVKSGGEATTNLASIVPYMANVTAKTTGTIDHYLAGQPAINCATSTNSCFQLPSGAVMATMGTATFAGTNGLNALLIIIDSDGVEKAGNIKSRSAGLLLSFDGQVTDAANARAGTLVAGSAYTNCSGCNPAWLKW
jgi:prepilin-type N-terminal cleavage/methylation domain-containing protein